MHIKISLFLLSRENETLIDLSLSGLQLLKLHIDLHLCGQSGLLQFIAKGVLLVLLPTPLHHDLFAQLLASGTKMTHETCLPQGEIMEEEPYDELEYLDLNSSEEGES